MVTTIANHASQLGKSICEDYDTLSCILARYEALIRKRWLKKTTVQRRDVLLHAWPNMPETHRPDCLEMINSLKQALSPADRPALPSPACIWPYINIEDLTRPKSLLVFLNARGRAVPLAFAITEEDFSPLAEMSACGAEPELIKYFLYLSAVPDPLQYGSTIIVDKDLEEYEQDEHGWSYCMRPNLQVLYIQERILHFLVACCAQILHDVSEGDRLLAAIQAEPPASDLMIHTDVGHNSFSDSLVIAPYRNRETIDFARLYEYIGSLLTNAKDHLWALREDPSYMADMILEYSEHSPEMIPDRTGRIHPRVDTAKHLNGLVREMVIEAYRMLHIWDELHAILKELTSISTSMSKEELAPLMAEIDYRARNACSVLTRMVDIDARSSPTMRHLYSRHDFSANGEDYAELGHEKQACKSLNEFHFSTMLNCFDISQKQELNTGKFYHMLDSIDSLVRTDPTVKALLTPKLARLITQLSLAVECVVQHSLWSATPSAQGIHKDVDHRHDLDFDKWLQNTNKCSFPVRLINPSRGKLRYPIHKSRNRTNVQALRTAEANVDAFWNWVDTYFEQKTGVAQHEVLRRCILEGGKMQRTAPWEDPQQENSAKAIEKPEYIHQPFSRIYHQRELQITGAFDRMSIDEKTKLKTKGTPATSTSSASAVTKAHSDGTQINTLQQSISLDKRAYKAMKALFHIATSEAGDSPKALKWDEFKRAMLRVGFSAEKLQGSAWQFLPSGTLNVDRGIQFHEPHPDSDIPCVMARRFGRRLGRVYGWNGDVFKLA